MKTKFSRGITAVSIALVICMVIIPSASAIDRGTGTIVPDDPIKPDVSLITPTDPVDDLIVNPDDSIYRDFTSGDTGTTIGTADPFSEPLNFNISLLLNTNLLLNDLGVPSFDNPFSGSFGPDFGGLLDDADGDWGSAGSPLPGDQGYNNPMDDLSDYLNGNDGLGSYSPGSFSGFPGTPQSQYGWNGPGSTLWGSPMDKTTTTTTTTTTKTTTTETTPTSTTTTTSTSTTTTTTTTTESSGEESNAESNENVDDGELLDYWDVDGTDYGKKFILGGGFIKTGPFEGSEHQIKVTWNYPTPDSTEGEPAPARLPFLEYSTAVQLMNLNAPEKPDPNVPVSDPTPTSSLIAGLSGHYGEGISISAGTPGIDDAYTVSPKIANIWDPTSEGSGWSGRTPEDLSVYYNRWIIVDPAENQ